MILEIGGIFVKATVKEIALDAKVSTATVSNVLTKKKYVSAELEKKF